MSIFARSLVFSFVLVSVGCGTAKFVGNGRKMSPAPTTGSAGQDPKSCLPLVGGPIDSNPDVTVPGVTLPIPADEDPNQNGDNIPADSSSDTTEHLADGNTATSAPNDEQPVLTSETPVIASSESSSPSCTLSVGTENAAKN